MQHTARSALRLLHYWWPLALGWSLTVVIQRATGRSPDAHGVAALLGGIMAAYSIDRILDPSEPALAPWLARILGGVGLIGCAVCAAATLGLPVRTAAVVPTLAMAALLYPRLKRLPLTKTVILPFIWTWAAVALPFNDGSWLGWHALVLPVVPPLLLLIGAGCLLCDLKDEDDDRRSGVRSLPALLGGTLTVRVAVALAVMAAGLALVERRTGIVVSAAALSAVTASPALLATDAFGPLLVDVILTLPGILISARVV